MHTYTFLVTDVRMFFSAKQLFHQYSKYIYTFVGTYRLVNNNPSFSTHSLVQIVLDNTDKQL